MSFFDKLAHQISANAENPPAQLFSASITRAGDVDEFLESIGIIASGLCRLKRGRSLPKPYKLDLPEYFSPPHSTSELWFTPVSHRREKSRLRLGYPRYPFSFREVGLGLMT
jgi:hypothetical protein